MIDPLHRSLDAALEGGRIPIVIFLSDPEKSEQITDGILFASREKTRLPLSEEEEGLLLFSHEIMCATMLSHRIKASGRTTMTLTGFEAGFRFFKKSRQDWTFIPERMRTLLEQKEVLIISGIRGMTEEGLLFLPDRITVMTMISDMAQSLDADCTEIVYHENSIALKPLLLTTYNRNENDGGTYRKRLWPAIPSEAGIKEPLEKKKVVTGIVVVMNVVEFLIRFSDSESAEHRRLEILQCIAQRNISLDMINICYASLNFITLSPAADTIAKLLHDSAADSMHHRGMAKLSIKGVQMKGTPGVMARIYSALESAHVEVLRSTDSHTTISCLIEEKSIPSAINALRDEFDLGLADISYEQIFK